MTKNLLHGKELNDILNNQEYAPYISYKSDKLKFMGAVGLIALAYLAFSSMDFNDKYNSNPSSHMSIIQKQNNCSLLC